MAEWSISASTPAESDAVQAWAKDLAIEVRRPGFWGQFMGMGRNNIIHVKENFIKDAGDALSFGLKVKLANAPIHGDGWMEGNEEAITTYYDSVLLDRMTHTARS